MRPLIQFVALHLLAPRAGECAGWRWRGGRATIPVLLAQTDQTFTMVLYHADARSYLRTRAKHLFISPNAI